MMTEKGRKHLREWCRFVRVDDSDEDGIGEFTLKFKIRDEDMKTWMASLTYGDACEIARCILNSVCPGCEDFADDWEDPDNEKFVMDVWMEDGFIVMGGNYRT